jgi:ribosome-associated toxin RatA of RatAB toxin-antitoxin module
MVNTIVVRAPARLIYALASGTERWPNLLPHYRFVRVLSGSGIERTVEMGARRGTVPVRWVAVQRNDALTPSVYFRHIRGWTAGMEVIWKFQECNGETTVSISHALDFAFPIASRVIEKHVVAGYFIDGIAARTLATFKRVAEEIAGG